jgi:hypothetical protein
MAKNAEKMRSYYANWRAENEEARREANKAYRASNRQRRRELGYAWRAKNKHLVNLWAATRRANRIKATPSWANRFFMEEAYHLAKIRTKATGLPWEVDHIVPLQSKLVCGLHVENNLQVIPKSMNRRKSNIMWPDMPGAL